MTIVPFGDSFAVKEYDGGNGVEDAELKHETNRGNALLQYDAFIFWNLYTCVVVENIEISNTCQLALCVRSSKVGFKYGFVSPISRKSTMTT